MLHKTRLLYVPSGPDTPTDENVALIAVNVRRIAAGVGNKAVSASAVAKLMDYLLLFTFAADWRSVPIELKLHGEPTVAPVPCLP
jgi:hypothetical protein